MNAKNKKETKGLIRFPSTRSNDSLDMVYFDVNYLALTIHGFQATDSKKIERGQNEKK